MVLRNNMGENIFCKDRARSVHTEVIYLLFKQLFQTKPIG